MTDKRGAKAPRRFGCLRRFCLALALLFSIGFLSTQAHQRLYSPPVQRTFDQARQWVQGRLPADKVSDLIAFVCWGPDRYRERLFTLRADGSDLKAIFETTTQYVTDMSWSADGVWIAFALRYRYGYRPPFGGDSDSEIFRIRFDGAVFRRVTYNNGYDSDPQWLPDGDSLLSYQHGIVLHTSAGGYEIARIDPLHIWHYDLSPDGRTLAVISNSPIPGRYAHEIHRFNLDGGDRKYLADVGRGQRFNRLKWSPDGQYLMLYSNAYSSWRNKPRRLRIISAANGSDIASLEFDASDAEWSPRGRWVAVLGKKDKDAARELVLFDVETGKSHSIASDVGYALAWSPDGEWIAFYGPGESGQDQLFKVRRDGRELQPIAEMDCDVSAVSWSPV